MIRRGCGTTALGRCALGLSLAIGVAGPALAGPYADVGYDPILMVAWASEVDELVRGPMDIANPGLGDASFGLEANVVGPSTGSSFDVVSLGDGGSITLFFDTGISDGTGDDFAVFENAFFSVGGLFGEFAFVEVSSNGVDFARFEAHSLQTAPVPGGGVVDPTDYGNFAGDQAQPLGTGFDLGELAADPLVIGGDVDLADVSYVRLIDVIGDGTTLDAAGLPIYDPYPTPFWIGGFDLEAVGVIHPVPEPGSLLMFGAGTLLLAQLRKRRRPCCARDTHC